MRFWQNVKARFLLNVNRRWFSKQQHEQLTVTSSLFARFTLPETVRAIPEVRALVEAGASFVTSNAAARPAGDSANNSNSKNDAHDAEVGFASRLVL